MKKIGIFGCGVQKGGTTSLNAYLSEHPLLSAPKRKELHFFDDEGVNWNAPDYERIEDFFSDDGDVRQRFEITPSYIYWPSALSRIKTYNPDAKLIFIFRDPFERAWSHWCMEYARGYENLSFDRAIREGRKRLENRAPLSEPFRIFTYVERGYYGAQVANALKLFPRDQMLFLRSEDLNDRRQLTLNRICEFLSLPHLHNVVEKRENVRPDIVYPYIPTQVDEFLVSEELGKDLKLFAKLTGLDISQWSTWIKANNISSLRGKI